MVFLSMENMELEKDDFLTVVHLWNLWKQCELIKKKHKKTEKFGLLNISTLKEKPLMLTTEPH